MKGARTHEAIVQAAAQAFAEFGYDGTTLEQIAKQLGLTRGAVLFHFATKQAVLFAVIDTLLVDLDALLSEFERFPVPLAARHRRAFLTAYVDALTAHPEAAILLVRDIASVGRLRFSEQAPPAIVRVLNLLQGQSPDLALQVRTSATLGAIVRTLSVPRALLPELDNDARRVLVDSALAAYAAGAQRTQN